MIISRSDEIFGAFMYRWSGNTASNAEIMFELKRLKDCETMKDYFRVSRVGATLPLTRKLRAEIWGLYTNAKKHAAIELEMKEAGAI